MASQPGALDWIDELRAHPDRRTACSLGRLQHVEALQHAWQSMLTRDAVPIELDVAVTQPDAKVETAARPRVQVLRDRSQALRILHRQQEHPRTDAQPLGDRKD